MTTVVPGSDSFFFHSEDAIVEHLLEKININKKRCVGTEWELLFISPEGKPISRKDGQKAFVELMQVFSLTGYNSSFLFEESKDGKRIVGLNITGLGAIVPEAGHQFEFACSVCQNCDEVLEKNEAAYAVITEVAKRMNYIPVYKGFVLGYADNTEGMNRSRSVHWRSYYDKRFGNAAMSVRNFQDGTASAQVTIDSGAEKFHEFFQALLLIEPALSLHYANSHRSYVGVQAYGRLIPSQVNPITSVWGTRTPKEAIIEIVKRLLEIDVPFLPDPEWPNLYKAEPLTNNKPPTVRDIMNQNRLSEKVLNNIGGFMYMRPAFKNFSHALIEMRGVDTQSTPRKVTEIAQRVVALLYNDIARENLLSDYSHLSMTDIQDLHDASTMRNKDDALGLIIAGSTVETFVKDIIARSETAETQTILSIPVDDYRAIA